MVQDSLPDEFPYQQFIRQKIMRRKRTAVIGVPGCGKTRPIIDALGAFGLKGPILIICSGPAIATWTRQIPEWGGNTLQKDILVVRGTKQQRHKMWAQARIDGGIYITNFAVFRRDFSVIRTVKWAAAVADEYHKSMRRRKSMTYKRFLSMTRHMDIVILASGSLVSKSPASMFTAFQIIDPRIFSSYWRFVNTYCIVSDGAYGKEILGVKNVAALKTIMDRYLAYVPEEVVVDQLPEGRRMPLDVEMTTSQARVYKGLADDMIAVLEDGGMIIAPTVLTQLIRLRQLLCCPRAMDPTLDMGGGFEAIVERLEEAPHAVIFVPFRDACVEVSLELERRGYDVSMIRGGIDHAELQRQIDTFRGMAGVIVCTIAYAESFDLETCATSYFLEYDYSLDTNRQAEGRTRRAISEHRFVTWNYIRYKGTIDEDMIESLNTDAINVRRILSRPQALIDALKGGA